jgi:hypothetical protein
MKRALRRITAYCGVLALATASAPPARAQGTQGPIAPPPKFEVKRIPIKPNPDAPPVLPEEIIHRFAANEDLFRKIYDTYAVEEHVHIQEMGDDANPGGEYDFTGQIYTKPSGGRYNHILKKPVSTLKRTTVLLEDVQFLTSLPLFVLTTDQLQYYNLNYEGAEQLDQLHTYIFRVKPKRIQRGMRLFDGVVWVDDQDFAVVKSYGQFVTEMAGEGTQLPFKLFETYRENFSQMYWLPTYIRSDDVLVLSKDAEVPLRLVIRATNLHPQTEIPGSSTTGNAPAKTESSKPPQPE